MKGLHIINSSPLMKDERNINMVPYEHRSIYGDDTDENDDSTQDVHQNDNDDYGDNPLFIDNDNDDTKLPPSPLLLAQPSSIEPTTIIPKPVTPPSCITQSNIN